MIPFDENVRHEELEATQRYRYFNFGVLSGRGFGYIFDFMRYNVAFLARATDLENMREAVMSYRDWMQRPYQILLCRPDWSGKTKAHWEEGKLMSDMNFDRVDSIDLYELDSDRTEPRPPSPLKVRTIATAKGTLRWVLQAMYDNQAMPYREVDADKMEHAFLAAASGVHEPIEVELANYTTSQTQWSWPPVPQTK